MTRQTIQERLRALATGTDHRTKAGRFREVYPDIEAAITSGVSHTAIIAVLNDGGLEMSMSTFRGTLQRERAKRLQVHSDEKPRPPLPVSRKPEGGISESLVKDPEPSASHNPKDIDKIIASKPDLDALAKLGRSPKI